MCLLLSCKQNAAEQTARVPQALKIEDKKKVLPFNVPTNVHKD